MRKKNIKRVLIHFRMAGEKLKLHPESTFSRFTPKKGIYQTWGGGSGQNIINLNSLSKK